VRFFYSGIARSHIPLILPKEIHNLSAAPDTCRWSDRRSNYSEVGFTAEMSDAPRTPVSRPLRHSSTARIGCSSDHGRLAMIDTDGRLLTLRGWLPSVDEIGSPQCVVGGNGVVAATGRRSAAPVLVAGLIVVVTIRSAGRFLH